MSSATATATGGGGESLLDAVGAEITRIVTPVSACILIVVLLVSSLSSPLPSLPAPPTSSPPPSQSDEIWSAAAAAVVFVLVVTSVTFLLVFLFYLRCTGCLRSYTAFSSFAVLALAGGEVSLLIIRRFSLPLDPLTFLVLLANFAATGAVAVFASPRFPIAATQAYMVVIAVIVAYWFILVLSEWIAWALLVAMSVYDLAAVLLPWGPLRLLVELAISRDEEIPALVYEARPVNPPVNSTRRVWRYQDASTTNSGSSTLAELMAEQGLASGVATPSVHPQPEQNVEPSASPSLNNVVDGNAGASELRQSILVSNASEEHMNMNIRELAVEEGLPTRQSDSELSSPLLTPSAEIRAHEADAGRIGLGSSGAIKLGLGDFIFYSILVGRAALYDLMTAYACYLAIIAGLGITLMLLALYRKALPALPVSIMLGLLFYALSRTLLQVFVVQCSTSLLMF